MVQHLKFFPNGSTFEVLSLVFIQWKEWSFPQLESGDPRRRDDPKARMKLEPLLDQERERIEHTFPGPGGYTFWPFPGLNYGIDLLFTKIWKPRATFFRCAVMITFSVSYEIPSLAYGVKVFFGLFQFYFFFINRGERELLRGGDTH